MELKLALLFVFAFLHMSCAQPEMPETDDPAHKYSQHAQHQHQDPEVSSEEHFTEGEGGEQEHNKEYDHDSFLGNEEKEEFQKLSPEEAKTRLRLLFKKIDADSDNEITHDELKAYVKTIFSGKVLSGLDMDLEEKDADKDGKVSWEEFIKGSFGVENEETFMKEQDEDVKKSIDRDRKRFEAADADSDGFLTRDEYINFLHPESSPKMAELHVDETLEDLDLDKDGYLTLQEFLGDYKPEEETEKNKEDPPEWVAEETKRFSNDYDKNGDGKLDKEELKAWIIPESEDSIAIQEATHLIESADDNKDGKLDVEEMVNNHEVFVSSEITDFGKDLPAHDEL